MTLGTGIAVGVSALAFAAALIWAPHALGVAAAAGFWGLVPLGFFFLGA